MCVRASSNLFAEEQQRNLEPAPIWRHGDERSKELTWA